MSLSTKLTTVYATIVIIVAGILTFTLYVQMSQAQRGVIREHLHDVVSFTVNQIDGDFHTLITAKDDKETSYYRIIRDELHAIQATSSAILHIYTVRQQGDGQVIFVVDNGTTSGVINTTGTELVDRSPLLNQSLNDLTAPVVEKSIQTDATGRVLLYGYGPIRDQFGRQDGVVIIEFDASKIIDSEFRARNNAMIAFIITLPFLLVIGIVLVHRLTTPVAELLRGVERIAQGELDHRVRVHTNDELGLLAKTFNSMADSLQGRIVTEQEAQHALSASHEKLQAYNHTLEEAMQEQARLSEAVRQLSLPIIPIAQRIILVPLVGSVDGSRAGDLVMMVLHGVERYAAHVILLDLTGVLVLDDLVAQALVEVISGAQLLGARVLVLGVRPELAETFMHVGVDLRLFETSATLQSGLLRALKLTGVEVIRHM